jgi:hypothetical protein
MMNKNTRKRLFFIFSLLFLLLCKEEKQESKIQKVGEIQENETTQNLNEEKIETGEDKMEKTKEGEDKIKIIYEEGIELEFLSSKLVFITWEGKEKVDSYEVSRVIDGEKELLALFPSSITFYPDGDVKPGKKYCWEVKGKSAEREKIEVGKACAEISEVEQEIPPPPSPSNLKLQIADGNSSKIILEWQKEEDNNNEKENKNENKEIGFKILKNVKDRFVAIWISPSSVTSFEVEEKEEGEHCYSVISYGLGGDAGFSDEVCLGCFKRYSSYDLERCANSDETLKCYFKFPKAITLDQRKAFEEFKARNGGNWIADWNDVLGNPVAVFVLDGKYTKKKPIPNHFFEGIRLIAPKPSTFTSSHIIASPLRSPVCDETGEVCLKKFDRSTDYFSPNGDGRLDEVEFFFTILIKHAEYLQVKRYFLTWALSIYDEKGKLINEFSSFKEEILPPFDCVTWDLKPIEQGRACQYVRKNMKTIWNGKDFEGKIQSDGAYYYAVYLLVEREDGLGNGGTMIKKIGEIRTERASVVLDTEPPFIVVSSPQYAALIQSKTPYFLIEFWDETSGILKESFQIFLDREEITSNFQVEENKAYFTPSEQLSKGTHRLQVKIKDKAGNLTSAFSYFTIISYEDIKTIEKVVAFLSELKDVYGFKEDLEDLKIDEIGANIIRFAQFFKGIPVETELIVATDSEGNPSGIFGEYYIIPETFPTIPKLSSREIFLSCIFPSPPSPFFSPLYYLMAIIRDKNGILHLTYKVFITFPAWLWIDAFDGNLVEISKLVFYSYY